jgi:hypothetical protein
MSTSKVTGLSELYLFDSEARLTFPFSADQSVTVKSLARFARLAVKYVHTLKIIQRRARQSRLQLLCLLSMTGLYSWSAWLHP